MFVYNFFRTIGIIVFTFWFRVSVINREKLPKSSCIYCLNHKSNFDPIMVSVFFKGRPSFLAKEELYKNLVTKFFLTIQGAIPVKREKGDISAVKSSLKVLKQGRILTIFPEGTRVRKGQKPPKIKPGIAMIALRAKVPVVPIAINGEYKFWGKIKYVVGDPIYLDEYYDKKMSLNEYQELSEKIMGKVRELQEV